MHTYWKEEINLPLFSEFMIVPVENSILGVGLDCDLN
jgi:hypothetical protein